MPVVAFLTERLRELIGRDLSGEQIADAIDQIGCDLDELVEVLLYECPNCGGLTDKLPREEPPRTCAVCGREAAEPLPKKGSAEVVRLDLVPARPDLFEGGGLARAVRGYLGIETGPPRYEIGEGEIVVRVDPSVRDVRPVIVCAEVVLERELESDALVGIFQLQENLHWAVGRDRKKASIGVYDLATHGTEIAWTAEPPDYRFTPLGMPGRVMTLAEILAEHPKGMGYRHLLEPYDRYPILRDSAGQVLSMPPIINSEETKLAVGARRLFIDVTGHDRKAAEDCLALLVTAVCEQGGAVRTVKIVDGDEVRMTPDLTPQEASLDPERASRLIGVPLTRDEVVEHLDRMRLGVENPEGEGAIEVRVPRYRLDVKHEVDLVEDVAIAHGYHNLPTELVPTMTVGREIPLNRLSRGIRRVLTGLGFVEVLTFFLTNREEHLERMRLPSDLGQVEILNPISVNQTMLRVHLLSGLMATFALNRTREMPQPIFEIGDVATGTEDSAAQMRRLGIGVMGPRADYASIRATVDALVHEGGLAPGYVPGEDQPLGSLFLPGRVARVSADGTEFGVLGEVHPEVITAWGLDQPVVLAEIDVERLPVPVRG